MSTTTQSPTTFFLFGGLLFGRLFFHGREGVLGALDPLLVSRGAAPIDPAMLRFASSATSPAMGTAPLPVSSAVAVGVRKYPAFLPGLLAARKLGDLVIRALVKTISANLHELIRAGPDAPSFTGDVRPRCALSSF